MERGLFDDIDINELSNSEDAIIETTKGKTKVEKKSTEKVDEEDPLDEDPNDINIEDLESDDEEVEDKTKNVEDNKEDKTSTEDTKKTKTPANDANAASSSNSALPSLALVLKEAGVFSSLSDEELVELTDVEGIVKAVEKQIKANELADLSDEDKAYLEARRSGVSHTNFVQSKANAEQYKNLTDELIGKNQNIQFELIKRSYLVKGIDDKTATKLASKQVEDEDAVEEAIAARDGLVKFEEDTLKEKVEAEKTKTEKKIKEQTEKLENLKSKINENSEILPGIKVNSQTKDKIFSSMTTPVKNKENKLLNEVMDLYESDNEYKMKLHALHILTKGLTDFSKFKNSAKSSAVEDLEKKLAQTGAGATGSSKTTTFQGSTTKELIASLPDFSRVRK